MNRFIRSIGTAGSVALILGSGAAWADPPATFGQWSVNSSGFVVYSYGGSSCPTGYTCGTAVEGAGFSQRQITNNSTGDKYFQTVVTPENATSVSSSAVSFADESFVKVGFNGVSSNQRASDTSVSGIATTDFNTVTSVNSGWAAGGSTFKDLQISQTETVTNNKGTASAEIALYNGFTYNQNGVSTAPTGKFIEVAQAVQITPGATLSDNADDDVQKFVMRQASGTMNGAARASGASPALLGSTNSADLNWGANDDVKVIYVGQQMNASLVDAFRFQAYDNMTTGSNDAISSFEVGQSSPFSWVNPFGANPVSGGVLTVP